MGGPGDPMGFRPNPAIEKWAKFKEDYHLRFRYTPRRVFDIALWGFVVPIGVYYMLRNEHQRVERSNNRNDSKYLG